MRWMVLALAIAVPVAADEVPAQATVPAPATAAVPAATTAPEGYMILLKAPAAASQPAPAVTTATQVMTDVMNPSCAEIKAFKDKMHAAVDAALKYPAELKFRPTAGVTIVTYDYQDGRTENPHITQWSGDGRLDRAALKAVKEADFASIRPGIGHTHIHDAVIIVFDNSANLDKNAAERPKQKDPAADPCHS